MLPTYRLSTSVSRLQNMRSSQPVRSIMRTRVLAPSTTRQFSRGYGLFNKWEGSGGEDSNIKRARKGDTNDPPAEATESAWKEKEESEGIADDTKQAGATERGGRKHAKKAKEEHPAAPEPVLGMNDERAGVRLTTPIHKVTSSAC